jgi:hypothetical protein
MTDNEKAELLLEGRFYDRFVKFTNHVGEELYGRVDRIAIDNSKTPHRAIVMIDMMRFEVDLERLEEHITLI